MDESVLQEATLDADGYLPRKWVGEEIGHTSGDLGVLLTCEAPEPGKGLLVEDDQPLPMPRKRGIEKFPG